MTLPASRGASMEASVLRIARASGVGQTALLRGALALAVAERVAAFDGDEHHPLYLHPGRTVLVLIRDAGVVDVDVLAAAALTDSATPTARANAASVHAVLTPRAAALHAEVPDHHAPDLTERLVLAEEPVRLIALADHLDHIRHLHMLPGTDGWHDFADGVQRVWGPVAERTHPVLARRYGTWARTFARRLGSLGRSGTPDPPR